MTDATTPTTLFTIGHSNHTLETFLGLLRQHGIETLVDTRSRPRSQYVPHFNVEELKPAVEAAGIRFVFLGEKLGGRPDADAFYDADGHVLYGRVAEAPFFLEALTRVEKGAKRQRVALLCAEENPLGCHRHRLVGRVLRNHGLNVLHIRGDGRLQTSEALDAEEAGGTAAQPSLFDAEEMEESRPWRSLQSVSRRRAPNSFSR